MKIFIIVLMYVSCLPTLQAQVFFAPRPSDGEQVYWNSDSTFSFTFSWNDSLMASYGRNGGHGTLVEHRKSQADTVWDRIPFSIPYTDTVMVSRDGSRIVSVSFRQWRASGALVKLFDESGQLLKKFGKRDFCPPGKADRGERRAWLWDGWDENYWGHPVGIDDKKGELLLDAIPGGELYSRPEDKHVRVRIRLSDGKVMTPVQAWDPPYPKGPDTLWSRVVEYKGQPLLCAGWGSIFRQSHDSNFVYLFGSGVDCWLPGSDHRDCFFAKLNEYGDILRATRLPEEFKEGVTFWVTSEGSKVVIGKDWYRQKGRSMRINTWAIIDSEETIIDYGYFPRDYAVAALSTTSRNSLLVFLQKNTPSKVKGVALIWEYDEYGNLIHNYDPSDIRENEIEARIPLYQGRRVVEYVLSTLRYSELLRERGSDLYLKYYPIRGFLEFSNDTLAWNSDPNRVLLYFDLNTSNEPVATINCPDLNAVSVTGSRDILASGSYTPPCHGDSDVLIVRAEQSGKIVWASRFGESTRYERALYLFPRKSGGDIIIANDGQHIVFMALDTQE